MSSKLLYPFLELSHAPWFVPVLQVACRASSCRYIRLRFQVLSDDTNEGSAVIPNSTTPLTLTVTYFLSLPISTPLRPSTELASVALSICIHQRLLLKVSQPPTCGRHKASIRVLSSTIFCIHVEFLPVWICTEDLWSTTQLFAGACDGQLQNSTDPHKLFVSRTL